MNATIAIAARELGLSPAQIRRDIAAGAPVLRRGSVGRGRGSLLDLEVYRRWRARESDPVHMMQRVAEALSDVMKRDAGEGVPAHVSLGIRRGHAAVLLAIAYERIHRAVTGREAECLPAEIAHAVSNLSDSSRIGGP